MNRSYDWILFDLDETLFDFPAKAALQQTLDFVGLSGNQEATDEYHRLNRQLWDAFQQGEIDAQTLQYQRFAPLALRSQTDPLMLNSYFLERIAEMSRPLDGVMETLAQLRDSVKMGIITNGFAPLQRERLAKYEIEHWFTPMVISDEVGHAKPNPKIFHHALAQMGEVDPARVLMVGDNPDTDILGARQVGMATCWFNSQQSEGECDATHRIDHFSELLPIIIK